MFLLILVYKFKEGVKNKDLYVDFSKVQKILAEKVKEI
jgi:hypothetical protein